MAVPSPASSAPYAASIPVSPPVNGSRLAPGPEGWGSGPPLLCRGLCLVGGRGGPPCLCGFLCLVGGLGVGAAPLPPPDDAPTTSPAGRPTPLVSLTTSAVDVVEPSLPLPPVACRQSRSISGSAGIAHALPVWSLVRIPVPLMTRTAEEPLPSLSVSACSAFTSSWSARLTSAPSLSA